MRCSSPTCECNMCSGCGKQHSDCICDLIAETQEFLNELEYEDETRARSAEHLLKEWLDATKT